MSTLAAVQQLTQLAQREARTWYLAAAALGTSMAVAVSAVIVAVVLRVSPIAAGRMVAIFVPTAMVVTLMGTVWLARRLIARRIRARRPRWIEEVARREGVSAEELGSSFTAETW